jgi:hypothetical protein
VRAKALIAGGLLAALTAIVVSGCAAGTGRSASAPAAKSAAGSAAGCTTDAYRSIRAHQRLASVPAACRALTPSQRNEAVGLAIRMASGTGSKSEWRRQASAAAAYVSALITGPAPTVPPTTVPAPSAGGVAVPAASRLGFSESATEVAALLAWLATAGSGGWILIRWRRAGGRLARPRVAADTAAPSAVILGHVGLGLLGLALWALFIITGWAALAWISVALLAWVAGLGMTVLFSGLPRPRPPAPTGATRASASPPRSGRQPAAAIAAHGLFVLVSLLLVLLAAIGA